MPELNERIQVQSDLNQTIESEFSDAGIEIPFPQSDLHLRSVDADAAALLAAGSWKNEVFINSNKEKKMKRTQQALTIGLASLFIGAASLVHAGYGVGTIVKVDGESAEYMMVPVGKAAHIPHPLIIQCLGIQNRTPVYVRKDELNAMPKSALLFKSPAGAIYVIKGDRKRHVANQASFQRHGFDPASVLPMTDAQLNCIPDGPPM